MSFALVNFTERNNSVVSINPYCVVYVKDEPSTTVGRIGGIRVGFSSGESIYMDMDIEKFFERMAEWVENAGGEILTNPTL
jgi:hypothetical protein